MESSLASTGIQADEDAEALMLFGHLLKHTKGAWLHKSITLTVSCDATGRGVLLVGAAAHHPQALHSRADHADKATWYCDAGSWNAPITAL